MTGKSPSRLELLRFARRVVMQQATASLWQIDGWIAEEERREAAQRRTGEWEQRPEWLVQFRRDGKTVDSVHSGACWAVPKGARCRPVSRVCSVRGGCGRVSQVSAEGS
ncbi:hypothetical protein [Streptomyces sp. NPDC048106]|uniref:hypothetical protein n=1 Tax=Streptomyces sp. NPDC048106 TaxID=3155750 RepID=UPI0034554885